MQEGNIILQIRNLLIIKPIFLKSEKIQMSALMLDKNKSRRKIKVGENLFPGIARDHSQGEREHDKVVQKGETFPPPPKFDVLLKSDYIIISIDCIRI